MSDSTESCSKQKAESQLNASLVDEATTSSCKEKRDDVRYVREAHAAPALLRSHYSAGPLFLVRNFDWMIGPSVLHLVSGF